eukprot:6427635-Pyramimonas_sp.AAC.1
MAKAFPGPVMEKAHQQYGMQIILRTFVDDTVIRVEGAAKQTTSTTITAGATVCEQLQQVGLVISEKATVVASDNGILSEVAAGLRRRGVPVIPALEAVDLGMDTSAGRRRTCSKANERRQKAAKRTWAIKRTRRHAKLRGITTALWTAGSRPQGTYAHQAFGVAGHVMTELRRQAAQCSVGAGPGRCLTTSLAMVDGNNGSS